MFAAAPSHTQWRQVVASRKIVDGRPKHTPIALRLRAVLATRHDLVDLTRVVQDAFHLGTRFHPFVGGVEFAPQPIRRAVQISQRIVQLVFFVLGYCLLRLGRRAAAGTARSLRGLSAGLPVFSSVLRPFPEFIHAVLHFADAIGDLDFREHHLRRGDSTHTQARENGSDENWLFHHEKVSRLRTGCDSWTRAERAATIDSDPGGCIPRVRRTSDELRGLQSVALSFISILLAETASLHLTPLLRQQPL